MDGTARLTPDELANLVGAVFQANGYEVSLVGVFNQGENLNFDEVRVTYKMPPLKVRISEDEQPDLSRLLALRSILHPEVPSGVKRNGNG